MISVELEGPFALTTIYEVAVPAGFYTLCFKVGAEGAELKINGAVFTSLSPDDSVGHVKYLEPGDTIDLVKGDSGTFEADFFLLISADVAQDPS